MTALATPAQAGALPCVPEGFSNAQAVHWVAEGGLPLMEHHPGLPFADDECVHGRLNGDSTPPCGCWLGELEAIARTSAAPEPVLTTPDPTPEPTPEEEPIAMIASITPDADAPYGRKADGSPRKRPGRTAKPKAQAATPARTPEPELSGTLAKIVGDIDVEILRLGRARAAIIEAIAEEVAA